MEMLSAMLIFYTLSILLLGLTIAVSFDHFIKKEHRRVLLIIVALLFVHVSIDIGEYYLEQNAMAPIWRTLVSIVGYSLRPLICCLFLYLIGKRGKLYYVAWGLTAVNALIYLTAFFSDVTFKISDDNHFIRGPLGFTCYIISFILLGYVLFLSIKECRRVKKAESVMPLFNMLIIVISVLFDTCYPTSGDLAVSGLSISLVASSVFYYVWLHLRFVRDHEQLLREEHRNELLVSQIQPHFIYNTLFSIQNIEGNPEETKQAIAEFSNYIRGNLAALDGKGLIPFKSEMDFVMDYVSLQQRRFPDKYYVNYDLRDEDFSVPPLTVQILVENAMKHGIGGRYENGTITIRSRRNKASHVITVIDNGVGFDTDKLQEKSRVGLRAVKNRLEYYLNGTISIESRNGVGTSVTINIPIEPVLNDDRTTRK